MMLPAIKAVQAKDVGGTMAPLVGKGVLGT